MRALTVTLRTALIGRMQKLERLGLAEALAPAQWRLSEDRGCL